MMIPEVWETSPAISNLDLNPTVDGTRQGAYELASECSKEAHKT